MSKQKTVNTEEAQMRAKVRHYEVCFIDTCPLHEQCLRWLVGNYADPTMPLYTAINPRNPQMGGDQCPMYREKKRVVMKRGFTHLCDDMSARTAHIIRMTLVQQFGHKYYYEMRKGQRLTDPAQQHIIEHTCRSNGWTGPIVYDGEEVEWGW